MEFLNDIGAYCWNTPWLYALLVLLLAPLGGAVVMSLDRKLTARMQGRIGPSWFQPLYDVVKLFGKSPMALHRPQLVYATLHLVFLMVAVLLLAQGRDLLMVLFVQAFSAICLVLGGMSVRSPYSWLGGQRKILQMLALEPILLIMILAINLRDNSFLASKVMSNTEPLLLSMPLLFLAFLCVVAIELEKSPFDLATSHHAHQEIVKGITLEFSGPFLGLIEVAHFYEVAFFFGLLMAFWHTSLLMAVVLGLSSLVFLVALDNSFARLTSTWMLRFMWSAPLSMALANLIWLWV